MLVSVVERTREIGLRQALGASKRIIVGQILNESLVFSAAGSVLGLIAAYFTAPALISTILEEAIYTSLSDVGGLHPTLLRWRCLWPSSWVSSLAFIRPGRRRKWRQWMRCGKGDP